MAIAAAAVAVVGGVVQIVSSAKQAKRAKNAIKNYKRQELKNAYGDLTVSTKGADLQREELARASATSIQALRSGGIRGVVGGAGQVQQSNMLQGRVIGADLDRQRQQIDQLRATDEVRIQQGIERREEEDLKGLGQQLQAGRQGVMNGIGTATQGIGSMAGSFGGKQAGAQENTMGQGFDYQMPSASQYSLGAAQPAVGGNPYLGRSSANNAFGVTQSNPYLGRTSANNAFGG